MAGLNPVDRSKIHDYKYLGWGVDCRQEEEEWRNSLKSYDGEQIRDIANNINEIPCDERKLVQEMYSQSRGRNIGGGVGAEVPKISLNAELKLGFKFENASKSSTSTECIITKTVTLQEDISRDPQVITMTDENGREVHYSMFELFLSDHILQYIDRKQRKFSESRDLGESVQSLQGENAIERLQNFTKRNKTQLWQLVADACTNFIDKEFRYTHYVYSITKGKLVTKEKKEEKQKWGIDGKGEAKAPVKGVPVGGEISGEVNKSDHNERYIVKEMMDEVIQVKIKPLSTLISGTSKNLKAIMENLLDSYGEIMEREPSGPFIISCQDEKGKEIFWQTVDEKIYGTLEAKKASEFYIKCYSSKFCIINKKAQDRAKFMRIDKEEGIHLVPSADLSEISLVVEDCHYTLAKHPTNPNDWTTKGPFFIKLGVEQLSGLWWCLQKIGISNAPWIPYVAMEECSEEELKYKLVSTEKINKAKSSLMLFTMKYQTIQQENMSLGTVMATASNITRVPHAIGVGGMAGGGHLEVSHAIRVRGMAGGGHLGVPHEIGVGGMAGGGHLGVAAVAAGSVRGTVPMVTGSSQNTSVTSKISSLVGDKYNFPHTVTASQMMSTLSRTV